MFISKHVQYRVVFAVLAGLWTTSVSLAGPPKLFKQSNTRPAMKNYRSRVAGGTSKRKPTPNSVKKFTATNRAQKKTTAKPQKSTKAKPKSKAPTTEELHEMYNKETGKKAIWRGKESSVYLKWLEGKKKDLGL